MPRGKKAVSETPEVPVEAPVEPTPEPTPVPESEAKAKFRAHIEAYKAYNPGKYALKEAELLKRLNSL